MAARAGGKQARARAALDRARSILLVAGTAEELVAQEPLVARLRQLGHQVRWAYAEGRLPTRWSRAVQTQVPAPRRLVAARTPSRPHRAVLTLAPRVLDQRRRLTLAARFDPWFRTAARGADDVVLLGSGEAVRPVLAALELTPRVHTDAQGLAALTDRLWIDHLQAQVATARAEVARVTPRRQVAQIDPAPWARLCRALDDLVEAAAAPVDLSPSAQQVDGLTELPGRTRDPEQILALLDRVEPIVGAPDPVLTAYRTRAELDRTGATCADPAEVARALFEHLDPLLAPPDEGQPIDPDALDRLVPWVCLGLEILLHRELHSDSVDSPLLTDPQAYLEPLARTRAWRLLTTPPPGPQGQQPTPGHEATAGREPTGRSGRRVPARVLVLPGPYGNFFQPLVQALEVSPAARVRTLARSALRPHLRTMGVSAPVVRQRLRAAAGLRVTGYPELERVVRGWDPDVLVIDWADKTAVLATLLAPSHTRIVLRVHGVDALRPWIHLLDWSRIEAVVAVSDPLAELVRDVVGDRVQASQLHGIPNLVDLGRFAVAQPVPREPHTLVMVGWAQRVKDPLWAVELLAQLRTDGRPWRLLLLGADFPVEATASGTGYAEAFRQRAMADDVRDHIEYAGYVTDLPPVLARPGFVLSTSLRESWPVGPAEAVAAGAVPVIRDWPMLASRGGPSRSYPPDWVVASQEEAVARIRALADPGDRQLAATEATQALTDLMAPVTTRSALRRLVLGDLGEMADLSEQGRHDEALAVARRVVAAPSSSPATLRQASITAAIAGEQQLRLAALRQWAVVDPQEQVQELVRQQEGRLRELDPQWEPRLGDDLLAAPRPEAVPGRVLHVLKVSLPHRQSGYALRSSYLLREQARAGLDVQAVTALDFPTPPDPAQTEHVAPRADREWVGQVAHTRLLREQIPRPEHPDEYLSAFAAALMRVVQEQRPALLHAHSGHRGYDLARVALAVGQATGVPVVYEVRGFFEALWTADLQQAERGQLYALRRQIEAHCLSRAAAVVTLSESMREDILQRRLPGTQQPAVHPDRVFVVPNGVDAQAVLPRSPRPDLVQRLGLQDRFVLGYVSNLDHPREGQELLIEAVHRLRGQGVPATALIVGGGARAELLQQLAQQRGVAEHVRFTGLVPHEEVHDYYALLDVFVVPRIDERAARLVTPLKPYEAMAMELPLVVSDLPALREIIGAGQRGESFAPGDADGLTRVLAGLFHDPQRRAELGRRGRDWVVRERSWAAAAARYQQVYDLVWGVGPWPAPDASPAP